LITTLLIVIATQLRCSDIASHVVTDRSSQLL
jgi:hypothetical protein